MALASVLATKKEQNSRRGLPGGGGAAENRLNSLELAGKSTLPVIYIYILKNREGKEGANKHAANTQFLEA